MKNEWTSVVSNEILKTSANSFSLQTSSHLPGAAPSGSGSGRIACQVLRRPGTKGSCAWQWTSSRTSSAFLTSSFHLSILSTGATMATYGRPTGRFERGFHLHVWSTRLPSIILYHHLTSQRYCLKTPWQGRKLSSPPQTMGTQGSPWGITNLPCEAKQALSNLLRKTIISLDVNFSSSHWSWINLYIFQDTSIFHVLEVHQIQWI